MCRIKWLNLKLNLKHWERKKRKHVHYHTGHFKDKLPIDSQTSPSLWLSLSLSLLLILISLSACVCVYFSLCFQYSLSLSLPLRFWLSLLLLPDQVLGKQSGKPIALIEVKSPWPLGKGGVWDPAHSVLICVCMCVSPPLWLTHSTRFLCHLSTPWRFNLSCLGEY